MRHAWNGHVWNMHMATHVIAVHGIRVGTCAMNIHYIYIYSPAINLHKHVKIQSTTVNTCSALINSCINYQGYIRNILMVLIIVVSCML